MTLGAVIPRLARVVAPVRQVLALVALATSALALNPL